MPAPTDGIDLDVLRALTDALLTSGAPIDEINTVRKHCSNLKGGQLTVAAAPTTTVDLVLSDVVGDCLDVIASGPLNPDKTTYADAIAVIDRYDLDVPAAVRERLERGIDGMYPETPAADDPLFNRVTQYVVADNQTALDAAAEVASDAGYDPLVMSTRIRGEAREAVKILTVIAEECAATGTPIDPPAVLLSGGETTVTIRGDGDGVGGPNQEFTLNTALDLV